MPEFIDRCVKSILKDKNFKPFPGKTKEESAYAICWYQYNKNQAVAKAIKKKK